MRGLNFPRKVLIGNFTPAVISSRSAGFETLLTHTTQHPKLRESSVLNEFLQGKKYHYDYDILLLYIMMYDVLK